MVRPPLTARLRDGTRIEIRPILPEDRETLRQGFERLSPESRYRRFFGAVSQLSERNLDYLSDVDHHNHEALVATDPDTGQGIGVARYVRTDADVAEPAVVVVDDWQGRGVGSELIQALTERARDEGVHSFVAPVLATNTEAIRLLESLGQTTTRRSGREVELTIELPPSGEPASWPALLRQFATGALEPARTVLDLLWPRRAGSPHDLRANVIVVGIRGEDDDTAAVNKAAQLALSSGARVEVVGAYRFSVGDHGQLAADVGAVVQSLHDRGIAAGRHVRHGDPALVLTDVAFECNARLIVVGAGQPQRTTRRLGGSVADHVAQRSPCDVLLVRDRPRDAERLTRPD